MCTTDFHMTAVRGKKSLYSPRWGRLQQKVSPFSIRFRLVSCDRWASPAALLQTNRLIDSTTTWDVFIKAYYFHHSNLFAHCVNLCFVNRKNFALLHRDIYYYYFFYKNCCRRFLLLFASKKHFIINYNCHSPTDTTVAASEKVINEIPLTNCLVALKRATKKIIWNFFSSPAALWLWQQKYM